jgi:hypothetical protein
MPTDPTFNDVWSQLRSRLHRGLEVRNWSREGDKEHFTKIVDLNYDEIVVLGERGTTPRRVSRDDFKKVFAFWEVYKDGIMSRDDVQEKTDTRNSSYIFALLHWLEEEQINPS